MGCRIGEALALEWADLDLEEGRALISTSIDFKGQRGETKTGRARSVELSTRLQESLRAHRPDLFGLDAPVFSNRSGGRLEYQNFRSRVFAKLVLKAFGQGRRVTPHCLRHTFASLHLARATNLLWVQQAGGWSSAKMLLDVYGHFMPTETRGFADAITAPDGPIRPARPTRATRQRRVVAGTPRSRERKVEPTIRFERTTCSLRDPEEGEEDQ